MPPPNPRGRFSRILTALFLGAAALPAQAASPKTLMILVDWWWQRDQMDTLVDLKVTMPANLVKRTDGSALPPLVPTKAYTGEPLSWWYSLDPFHPDQYMMGRIQFNTTYYRVWFQNDSTMHAAAGDTLFLPDTQTTFAYQNMRTGVKVVDTLEATLPKRFVFPDTARYLGPKAYRAANKSETQMLNVRPTIGGDLAPGRIDSCMESFASDTLWLQWRVGNSPASAIANANDMKCFDHNPFLEPHGSVAVFAPWTGAKAWMVVNGGEVPLRRGPIDGWFQGEVWSAPKDVSPASVTFRFLRSDGEVRRIDSSGSPFHFTWKSKQRIIQPTLGTLDGYDSTERRPPVVFAWTSPWASRSAFLRFGGDEGIQGQWSPKGFFAATIWGRPREASLSTFERDSTTAAVPVPPSSNGNLPDTVWLTAKPSSNFAGRLHGTFYDYRVGNPQAKDTNDVSPKDTNAYFPFSQTVNTGLLEGLLHKRLSSAGRPRATGNTICGMYQSYVENTLKDTRTCLDSANSPAMWFGPVVLGSKTWNASFTATVELTRFDSTRIAFVDTSFFPLDSALQLPGSTQPNPFRDTIHGRDGRPHNFGYCMELHGQAQTTHGATFTLKADDDTWIFVDSQLVVDLGGQRSEISASFSMERLPLPLPPVVSLDIFHCERHVKDSRFAFTANFPIHPVGTLKSPSRISSPRPAPAASRRISMQARGRFLSIDASPDHAWTLELRDALGRVESMRTGVGPTVIPMSRPGVVFARLRSEGRTIQGTFVRSR